MKKEESKTTPSPTDKAFFGIVKDANSENKIITGNLINK